MCRMTTGITNLGKSNALNLNMESDFNSCVDLSLFLGSRV